MTTPNLPPLGTDPTSTFSFHKIVALLRDLARDPRGRGVAVLVYGEATGIWEKLWVEGRVGYHSGAADRIAKRSRKIASKRKASSSPVAQVTSRTKTKALKGKEVKVKMEYLTKALSPHIPNEKDRRERLRENLGKMGCAHLMDIPWKWTSEAMVQEFVTKKVPEQFQRTVRGYPENWTLNLVLKSLKLGEKGEVIPQKASADEYQYLFKEPPHNSDG
jgi:hypothetical protein